MQFIHTADWHIGFVAKSLGSKEAAKKISEARFTALETLIGYAQNHDFILMAGDLFEDHSIDNKLVGHLADILKTYHNNIYFISGNHDPFGPRTLWSHPALKQKNIKILDKPEIVTLPDGNLLIPAPIYEKTSNISPFKQLANIKIQNDENLIKIGLAHGDFLNLMPLSSSNHPISESDFKHLNLNYLALGHWHKPKIIKQQLRETIAYAGTHEPQKFEEIESGSFFSVKIEDKQSIPIIKTINSRILNWEKKIEQLNSPESLKLLINKFKTLENTENTLLKLEIQGFIEKENLSDFNEFKNSLNRNFLFADIDDKNLNFKTKLNENFIGQLNGALKETLTELLNNEDSEINKQAMLEFLNLLNKSEDL